MRGVKIKKLSYLVVLFGIFLILIASLISAAKFNIGDTVEVYNTGASGLKVRYPDACSPSYAVKFDGARGSVLSGHYYCDGYYRWKIRWSDGIEGWGAEEWLIEKYIAPSTKFSIGDRVRVNADGVNVRNDPPELAYLGNVNTGDVGTVISGPFYGVPKGSSGFYYFWKIDYDTKTDGWTAENYLDKDSCTNECSSGQTRCNGNYKQTCGNYDADSCLEWPSSTSGDGNDDCSDCSCSCGGYNTAETTANGNCDDGKDNDCNGKIDSADSGCYTCTPKTCSQLGKSCGNWDDGCGNTINCGSCPTGQYCDNGVCKVSAQYINGIDVSGWQHACLQWSGSTCIKRDCTDINWNQVYSAGYRFAFVKSTQGDDRPPQIISQCFRNDMDAGKNAGLLMGAYHFGCTVNNATREANFFIDISKDYLKSGFIRPVLDMETYSGCTDDCGTDTACWNRVSRWIEEWMSSVEGITSIKPILYVNCYYARKLNPTTIQKYNLWIAHYTTASLPCSGEFNWDFWQYSDSGTVPGISANVVDLNRFNGDMAKLNTFLISSSDSPPTCSIQLRQKDTINPITQINVNEWFDIYIGSSSDDKGISEVRFSSDEFQDDSSQGSWTSWYGWSSSDSDWTGIWDSIKKVKTWLFATQGIKEVWTEIKDSAGQTTKCNAGIYIQLPCSCGSWQNQGCGQGGCAATKMYQTRTCTPSGCDVQSGCVDDASCQTCQGTDTSCGIYPNCVNCNLQDGCSGGYYRNYYCSGTSCSYTSDNCNDCSCSCGGYNTAETIANGNCNDGKDDDCDGSVDGADSGCVTCTNECSSGQTRCNGNYKQTCGNYDADSCLEWPSSTSGAGNEYCPYGCKDEKCISPNMITIYLQKDWNLISLPLELKNMSIYSIFNTTKVVIYGYKNHSFFIPEEIDYKLGYWVKINETKNITLIGNEIANKTINPNNGWNLIGYPYLHEINVDNFDLKNYSIFAYVNNSWSSYNPNKINSLNALKKLIPGYGYWVKK